ncbi:uncharacterized protein LOC135821894 [Sycon ciliatum]|uniref:uncharacterized protein LOC135821894 n=1 Tax=Sycon ciliatum TaxID=27933 RepID=UPI0031F60F42
MEAVELSPSLHHRESFSSTTSNSSSSDNPGRPVVLRHAFQRLSLHEADVAAVDDVTRRRRSLFAMFQTKGQTDVAPSNVSASTVQRRSAASLQRGIPATSASQHHQYSTDAAGTSVAVGSDLVYKPRAAGVRRARSFTSTRQYVASAPAVDAIARGGSSSRASSIRSAPPMTRAASAFTTSTTTAPDGGLRRSKSFLKRFMKKRVTPKHNLVGSVELILQLNPSHVKTDGDDRIPIVMDVVKLHNLDLAMAGLDQKDLDGRDLYLECSPMYTEGSVHSAKLLPIAWLKSDMRPAVLKGDVSIETQLTLVLSSRLFHQLTTWQVRLCLAKSTRKAAAMTPDKESGHVIATCSIDLLYIQRDIAVQDRYDLYYNKE